MLMNNPVGWVYFLPFGAVNSTVRPDMPRNCCRRLVVVIIVLVAVEVINDTLKAFEKILEERENMCWRPGGFICSWELCAIKLPPTTLPSYLTQLQGCEEQC